MEAFGLDRVLFVPARQNPLKRGRAQSEDRHRVAMLRLALAGRRKMGVALDELRREPPSFTIDTIRGFKQRHPTWELYLILGMDSLRDIAQWRCYKTLLRLCTVIPVERPGIVSPRCRIPGLTAEESRKVLKNVIAGRLMDISSTQVRRRVAKCHEIRYAVPRSVAHYITKYGLYR